MPSSRRATPGLLCLLIALLVGCTAQPKARHVIPFDLVGKHIVVPARLNGAGPYQLVVDTGAPFTTLSARAAAGSKAAGATTRGATQHVRGVGPASRPATMLSGVTIELPKEVHVPLTWACESSTEMFDSLSEALGTRFDGILGYDLFKRYVVEIDYDAEVLRLYEPAHYRYRGHGNVIPLVRDRGLAYLAVQVTPIAGDPPVDCRFALDTGSGSEVSMLPPLLERQPIDRRMPTRATRGMGAGGFAEVREGTVAQLRIGPVALNNVTADFSRSQRGLDFDGMIGAGLLLRFKMIVDYPHERLILEPGKRFANTSPRPESGIALIAGGAELREYRVLLVKEDSPGSEADVREGDVLVAVDHRPAGNWRLDDLNDLLAAAGKKRLTFRRGTEVFECTIEPRTLQ